MDERLQRRIQRHGWNLAAGSYEALWQAQLAPVQVRLLVATAARPGERVLDVACGTGLVSLAAAREVGPTGDLLGTDLSEHMVAVARQQAELQGLHQARFERMDAEQLELPDATFDAALCALGLMYLPRPEAALREMWRVLRSGGRMAIAIWGERARCGWAEVFPIVDVEVASDVCPLFFRLGTGDALLQACRDEGFVRLRGERIRSTLHYDDGEAACQAVFVGGPVALAWSRFDEAARARVRASYLASIARWRGERGYQIPGEFVIVTGIKP